jgi:hypothetical protein
MLLLKPDPRMCILVPPAKLPALGFTLVISTGCEHAGPRNARSTKLCRSPPARRPSPATLALLHLAMSRGQLIVCAPNQTPIEQARNRAESV